MWITTEEYNRLKDEIAELEKENDSLEKRVDSLRHSNLKRHDHIEKLDTVINAKNAQIERLEDSITEICEAKDELQRMCNDRYHLVKKYQGRCEWYSACLRKDRELIRQLREELEHKANFMCKPFLKEHEDMKKDFKAFVISSAFYPREYFTGEWKERYLQVNEQANELYKKWFVDK